MFSHELAHTGHQRILGQLKGGQDWGQEILADLSAALLCQILGQASEFLGYSFQKIEPCAGQARLTPAQGCLKLLSDVESVSLLILKGEAQEISEAGLPAA